ncbi:MAG: hypothetical protein QOF84_376 [Streptomyces sp.]|jgi:hypothetical protein|nr:hypothetical protein [Streptomyces sp.]
MDAAHDVPQVGQRPLGLVLRVVEKLARGLRITLVRPFRQPDPQRQ